MVRDSTSRHAVGSRQRELFAASPRFPDGLVYALDFLTRAEEAALLDVIAGLPLSEARYRQYTAKRRTLSYGAGYDFAAQALTAAPPIPDFLLPLREKVAAWIRLPAEQLTQALVTEYRPGTQLGWHRDVPDFGTVVGISLGGVARIRFRPHPALPAPPEDKFAIDLQPRSAYVLQRAARWRWQHAISPTKMLRWSITFRTAAERTSAER